MEDEETDESNSNFASKLIMKTHKLICHLISFMERRVLNPDQTQRLFQNLL